ncbi:M23 family metallopeptidase [Aeromicrobium wangtongii]|uniref:M23 family metallopeptidase n=1 Tax=Aeromicrobium wangtongii TaxID=2969247 RepID=UPI0020171CD0|nr:M23 family metallopeptidase [Aeromicrobium wangtongii]MCL3819591.1 M23 family metallopeptidase [Aeromicrobium wangtongii]
MPQTVNLTFPFRGRWLVQNSPANRVPSHGTDAFASTYAIDFVPVDARGRTARFSIASLLHPEPPDLFPGFGRPITAPAIGVVAAVHDGETDHDAFRGLPSVRYALTQHRRAARGWRALAGNHVIIEIGPGEVVALCHLQQGSVTVSVGQPVAEGDVLGRCGNSGNSTEAHVHVQVMDAVDPERATAVPVRFDEWLPRNREIVEIA